MCNQLLQLRMLSPAQSRTSSDLQWHAFTEVVHEVFEQTIRVNCGIETVNAYKECTLVRNVAEIKQNPSRLHAAQSWKYCYDVRPRKNDKNTMSIPVIWRVGYEVL